MKTASSLLIAILATVALPVLAQTARDPAATPRVDQRQINQEQRIDQGVASGALTGREAARLDRGQERVERIEDRAKADGTVTARERVRLEAAQDQQSRKIYRQKHDRQQDLNHDGRRDRPAR
jgi:hypothetical protein